MFGGDALLASQASQRKDGKNMSSRERRSLDGKASHSGGQHLLSRGTSQTRARGGGHQSALKRRGCGVSADAPRTKRRAGKKEEEGQTAGCWGRQNSVELGTGGLGHAEPGKAEATPEEETRGVESPSPSATGAGWRSCLIKPHFSLPRSTSLRIKKLSC